jgi:hypothetical protein
MIGMKSRGCLDIDDWELVDLAVSIRYFDVRRLDRLVDLASFGSVEQSVAAAFGQPGKCTEGVLQDIYGYRNAFGIWVPGINVAEKASAVVLPVDGPVVIESEDR